MKIEERGDREDIYLQKSLGGGELFGRFYWVIGNLDTRAPQELLVAVQSRHTARPLGSGRLAAVPDDSVQPLESSRRTISSSFATIGLPVEL